LWYVSDDANTQARFVAMDEPVLRKPNGRGKGVRMILLQMMIHLTSSSGSNHRR
jgi:hypothetical protein